jgi:hypothetical protein
MTDGNNGPGHDRCGGRTRTGGLCRRPAGWGTAHAGVGSCKLHGGSTPNHQAHAGRLLLEQAESTALAELHRAGVELLGNPLETLSQITAEAQAWQAILRAQVAELAPLTERAPDGVERVRATVTLYERAMDRTAAFAAMMCRLNIDDRLYKLNNRIAVAQGERLFVAVNGILEDLGHDPRDPAVRAIAGARFEQLVGAIDDG